MVALLPAAHWSGDFFRQRIAAVAVSAFLDSFFETKCRPNCVEVGSFDSRTLVSIAPRQSQAQAVVENCTRVVFDRSQHVRVARMQ